MPGNQGEYLQAAPLWWLHAPLIIGALTLRPPACPPCQARGLVESWLSGVEAGMRAALRAEGRRCMREYAGLPGVALAGGGEAEWALAAAAGPEAPVADAALRGTDKGGRPAAMTRAQWAVCEPAQLAVLVSNVFWCQAVEGALLAAGGGGGGSSAGADALRVLAARCGEQLQELIRLVRGGLTSLQRRVSGGRGAQGQRGTPIAAGRGLLDRALLAAGMLTPAAVAASPAPKQSITALITVDVHNRDVTRHLVEAGAASLADFEWAAQLRYEFDPASDGVAVRQLSAR
jgi:hypothetical protein